MMLDDDAIARLVANGMAAVQQAKADGDLEFANDIQDGLNAILNRILYMQHLADKGLIDTGKQPDFFGIRPDDLPSS